MTNPISNYKYSGPLSQRKNIDMRSDLLYSSKEYDQEIPQSQTADNPRGTARKSRSAITRHQEDKLSKAIRSLFPIKIVAILEWT